MTWGIGEVGELSLGLFWLVVFFTNNYKYNSNKIYYILYTEHTISIRVGRVLSLAFIFTWQP